MAAKHSRHIALTGPLAHYVDSSVAQGKSASVSEIVRTALRLMIERDETVAARACAPAPHAGQPHDEV